MTDVDDVTLVDLEVTGTTLRASDVAGNVVAFGLTGWDRLEEPHRFDEPIDAAVVGRVTEFRYDLRNYVGIDRLDGDVEPDETDASFSGDYDVTTEADERISLPDGGYLFRFEANVLVRVRFDGAATVRNRPHGELTVSFPHPTPVTFGFTTTVDYPRHEVTIEPTTAGIATAISHLSSSIETTAVDRVHRNYRGYPPVVALGAETDVPDPVREATPDTGIEVVVPDRLSALLPVAPLAYYLGARVRTADGRVPTLAIPSVGLRHEFDGGPAFGTEVADVLRRTFFLDLLASWTGPEDPNLEEHAALSAAGIDVAECSDAPIADRLATYLEYPTDVVDDVLPAWPYRVTVEPVPEHATALPHLLHDLAAIDVPPERGGPRSRDRGGDDRPGDCSSVDALASRRHVLGTLGDVDTSTGFSALPAAYENRLAYLQRDRDELSVTVVFAGDAVADRQAVVDRYARRDESAAPTVERIDDPTRDELADAFANSTHFLHYIGDCDGTGLACRDGYLTPADLSGNAVQSFQLDAPDARSVGVELVEAGSVAGVVRSGRDVADEVPSLIGELLLYGHSIATAHACAAFATDRSDGIVVGDGTHRFVAKWRQASIHALTADEDGGVSGTVVPFPVDPVGAHWYSERSTASRLMPATIAFDVEPSELAAYFAGNTSPVYFDGRFYWPEDHHRLVYPIA